MDFDFILILKIMLLVCLWALNLAFVLFIFNSRNISKKLSGLELVLSKRRKEAVSYLIPILINFSKKTKNLKMLVTINKLPLKDSITFIISSLLPIIGIFQILNSSFNITKLLFTSSPSKSK